MKIILVLFVGCFLLSPFFRTFMKNIHYAIYYSGYDLYHYIKEKQWERFGMYGIDMFIGMFGAGKTLTMTHRATALYAKYGDNLRFISNYHLTDIPYTPLVNFKQLVDLGTLEDDPYIGTVVLIDEISTVLSHRNFASFPIEMLSMLLQQRKRHVYIMCTAQRFFMVDKIWRSITTRCVDCKKLWRFANMKYYDAWDYEQAINSNVLKPFANKWYFVRNKDFDAYNTEEMISKQSAEDFISNEEAIIRKGLESTISNPDIVDSKHLTTRARKARKAR